MYRYFDNLLHQTQTPYANFLRRSMIIADETYCGSSSVGIEPKTLRLKNGCMTIDLTVI
jgi:hypothetical protein